jgi:sulfide dehydrogenase cytochrome subunit
MTMAKRPTSGGSQVIALSTCAALMILLGDHGAAAADDQGPQLAAVCASCHRLDGRDKGIPSIVGLDEAAIVAAMRAFKSGERPGQIMQVMSHLLSDEEVAVLARYLVTQKKVEQP